MGDIVGDIGVRGENGGSGERKGVRRKSESNEKTPFMEVSHWGHTPWLDKVQIQSAQEQIRRIKGCASVVAAN